MTTTGWMSRGGYAVGKYQGFDIYRDEEHGLYWQENGFFDCFKDVWDSIDDFNAVDEFNATEQLRFG